MSGTTSIETAATKADISAPSSAKRLSLDRPLGKRPSWRFQMMDSSQAPAGLQPVESFATASASFLSLNKMAGVSTIDFANKSGSGSKQKSNIQQRRAGSRRPSAKGKHLETPAIITLRKASATLRSDPSSSVKGRVKAPVECSSNAHRSPDSRRASRKGITQYEDKQRATGTVERDHSRPWETSIADDRDKESVDLPLRPAGVRRPSSLDKLCPLPSFRRPSVAIEPAITFADVSLIPRSFSVDIKSRKNSLLAIGAFRRASGSQLRSRDSIHEIIWDEDDSPSSWTTNSPASSTNSPNSLEDEVSGFANRTIDDYFRTGGLTATETRNGKVVLSPKVLDDTQDKTVLDPSSPTQDFLFWSWGNRGSKKIARDHEDNGPSSRSHNATNSGSIVPDISDIESFPPLLDRKSTFEWRKTPLVDLNDPTAGRESFSTEDLKPQNEIDDQKLQFNNPMISVPDGFVDRTGLSSKSKNQRANSRGGSAIGTSSHKRRSSTLKSGRNSTFSLQSLSVLPSQSSPIKRSLSVQVTSNFFDQQNATRKRRLNRSASPPHHKSRLSIPSSETRAQTWSPL
ncbi:hypothetical protein MMC20_002059 [Loxospora ochrophaea]|nr:hypothetical protein [Loxospora ochrophaea]